MNKEKFSLVAIALATLLFANGALAGNNDPNTPWPPGTGNVSLGVDTNGVQHPIQVGTDGTVQTSSSGGGSSSVTLLAGSAIAGKFGIDQTTPGTTNKVSLGSDIINSVLTAGSAIVGKFGIDQTTPGTTNKVSIGTDGTVAINTALPSGTNAIGAANTGALIPLSATQVISSHTFSAGASNNQSTIAQQSGQYSCMEQMIVHMDVSSSVVTGDVTVSDGTWTVHVRCVDTVTAGAWCPYDGPVLQSTAVNTTITATVPAMSGGGAGDVYVVGYTRAGGC